MKLKRLGGALFAAALLATAGVVTSAPLASADGLAEVPVAPVEDVASDLAATVAPLETTAGWSGQSATLCSNTSKCGISIGAQTLLNGMRENTPFNVIVDGQPDKSVQIRVFTVQYAKDGKAWNFVPISKAVSVTPRKGSAGSTYGTATVSMTVPTPPEGVDAGQIYIQTADFTKGASMIGTRVDSSGSTPQKNWQVYTSRARDKGFNPTTINSDGVMYRAFDAAVPGHKYAVQMLRGSKWVNITYQGNATAGKMGTGVVSGRIPSDVTSGKYRTRLFNVTKNIPVSPDVPWTYFTWSKTPGPNDPGFNVYTTPGTWNYNGRLWKTSCEPYSATTRCRTEIWATQITYKAGQYYRTDGFVFNNLTYKPSPRSIWRNNPLGGNGQVGFNKQWTGQDGRKWRTECDTAVSGRNGCRSYIWATVAEAYKTRSGATSYRVTNKWLFNNIVQFS
ncbi:hypothetical protein [Tessaracoccus flavescens]|uniref:Uncharacterized protein n=1 Tax=Tessaracoccus flavescens TaxID=399497 RepID=A0A1Q2CYP9_9ACTN|nr:hypothetical protein [Tessaracoccus flavescens]AQP51269.1 hypothetical protein BW733_10940 [Tessaracoccus flavescens]